MMKVDTKRFVVLFASLLLAGCTALGFEDNSGTQLRQKLQTLNGQNPKAAVALFGRQENVCMTGVPPFAKGDYPTAKQMCQWNINNGRGPDRFVQTGTTTTSTMVGMQQGNGWAAPIYQNGTQATGHYESTIKYCFVYVFYNKTYPDPDRKIIGSMYEGFCGP
jgi:hypothetical protein